MQFFLMIKKQVQSDFEFYTVAQIKRMKIIPSLKTNEIKLNAAFKNNLTNN